MPQWCPSWPPTPRRGRRGIDETITRTAAWLPDDWIVCVCRRAWACKTNTKPLPGSPVLTNHQILTVLQRHSMFMADLLRYHGVNVSSFKRTKLKQQLIALQDQGLVDCNAAGQWRAIRR